MRIFPLTSYNTKKNKCKTPNNTGMDTNISTLSNRGDNVSFGGSLPLICLIATQGHKVFSKGSKHSKFLDFIKEVDAVTENPLRYNVRDLVNTVLALSKTPKSLDENSLVADMVASLKRVSNTNRSSVKSMQMAAIEKLFPHISDNIAVHREAKKDLMLAICEAGDANDFNFINGFKRLSDSHYSAFKEIIIDKCLYSPVVAKNGADPHDFSNAIDLTALIDTLNPKTYARYLAENRAAILKVKTIAYGEAKERLDKFVKDRNHVYTIAYGSGCFPLDGEDQQCRTLIYALINVNGFNKAKVAKAFNIDPIYAEDIINDAKLLRVTEGMSQKDPHRMALFEKRIKEKLSNRNGAIKANALFLIEDSGNPESFFKYFSSIINNEEAATNHSLAQICDLIGMYGGGRYPNTLSLAKVRLRAYYDEITRKREARMLASN